MPTLADALGCDLHCAYPILETIRRLHARDVWLEVVTCSSRASTIPRRRSTA